MPLTIDEQRAALDQLNLLAINDIVDLWREASPLAPAEFRSVITAGVPELLDPYIAGAGDLAATWYEEAAPQLTYRATAAAMPPAEQLATSAQWALRATGEAALVRLAGFSKRAILGAQRDTVLANVAHEPGARWARHASA